MAFQHAQTIYKQNMKKAEAFKKTGSPVKNEAFTPASNVSAIENKKAPVVNSSPHTNAYQQNALQTASRGDLTLLLYNGCIKFIDKADKSLKENNMEQKSKFIIRAQDIIRELMVTLKTDTATGRNMYQLYDFIHSRLVEANVNNNKQALQEARDLTVDFRDTWKEMIKLDRQQRFGEKDQV